MPVAFLEHRVIYGSTKKRSVGLLLHLRIVQHLHKEQVGHLFQYGQGVGNASRPEGIPYLVYTVLDLTGNHLVYLVFSCYFLTIRAPRALRRFSMS